MSPDPGARGTTDARGVITVGSLNMDLVVRVARHPRPGETLLGSDYAEHPGGKGANQAVAAARLGARVRMIGLAGRDAFGDALVAALEADGVDAAGVGRHPRLPTGVAFIQVAEGGENVIVVAPGANGALEPPPAAAFEGAGAVLLQLEVPLAAVRAAARHGRAAGAEVVLNAAPAYALTDDDLRDATLLVVNEHEAATLLGRSGDDVLADPEAAARALTRPGRRAVVTLGARGAVWAEGEGGAAGLEPAPRIDPVDTTAAGDAFCGALAAGLTAGLELPAAVRRACAAGASAATRAGAQPSLPTPGRVDALLGGRG